MQNIIPLLALIRVSAVRDPERARHAIDAYADWVERAGGQVIDVEIPQMMACLPDAGQTLESLHALMTDGERFGFDVSVGIVQAIRASERVPRRVADFTERTVQTLVELAGAAGPQQICASPKLMSLLQLAVPDYAAWFEPARPADRLAVTWIRQRLVLAGRRLPAYAGRIRLMSR